MWIYKTDPKEQDQSWGDSIYTDFRDFGQCALKMCVEILDDGDGCTHLEEDDD